jgi:hypothetical protein
MRPHRTTILIGDVFTEFDDARKAAAERRLESVVAAARERLPVESLERLGELLETFLASLDWKRSMPDKRAA